MLERVVHLRPDIFATHRIGTVYAITDPFRENQLTVQNCFYDGVDENDSRIVAAQLMVKRNQTRHAPSGNDINRLTGSPGYDEVIARRVAQIIKKKFIHRIKARKPLEQQAHLCQCL